MARKHDSLREGAWLGVVVATSIWVWLAVVDAAVGQPFRTFTVLGGLALFTILHYLFNVVYGIVIVSLVHGAAREPSLVIGMAFGRSEEHTSELQSRLHLVCRLLLEKKKKNQKPTHARHHKAF